MKMNSDPKRRARIILCMMSGAMALAGCDLFNVPPPTNQAIEKVNQQAQATNQVKRQPVNTTTGVTQIGSGTETPTFTSVTTTSTTGGVSNSTFDEIEAKKQQANVDAFFTYTNSLRNPPVPPTNAAATQTKYNCLLGVIGCD